MSMVTPVLNKIYVLKCDGCCNHISNTLIQNGRGRKTKSTGVLLCRRWRPAFAQEACNASSRKCQNEEEKKSRQPPNKKNTPTNPNRGNVFPQLLIAASCLRCPRWKLSPFPYHPPRAPGAAGGARAALRVPERCRPLGCPRALPSLPGAAPLLPGVPGGAEAAAGVARRAAAAVRARRRGRTGDCHSRRRLRLLGRGPGSNPRPPPRAGSVPPPPRPDVAGAPALASPRPRPRARGDSPGTGSARSR